MIDPGTASTLLAAARAYTEKCRCLPDHLLADLAEIAESEHLSPGLRRAAAWLLRTHEGEP